MATKIIIKNSSVAGKVPDASALNAAELAVNLEDQKLYSKDADGNVFELGRGSTDSGGTGDRPTGPEIGDLYFDTDLEILLVWNGSEWEQITTGGDSLWVEDAGKLYPVTLTNNVQIGGTAAAPNIALEADGQIKVGGTYPTTPNALIKNDGTIDSGFFDLTDGIRLDPSTKTVYIRSSGPNPQATGALQIGPGNADAYAVIHHDGSASFEGKITAASTEDTDPNNTVVTKDYLEGAGSGGTGTLGYWDRTGTSLSPVNQGDDVLIGGTLPSAPNISLNASDGSGEFNGQLLVGTSNSKAIGTSTTGILQVAKTSHAIAAITTYANTNSGGTLILGKSRAGSIGGNTIVEDGDFLGEIRFAGADGNNINSNSARIYSQVDGTPGSTDMPGRLVFSTTANGESFPTERMRIDSSGRLGLGESAPDTADVKVTRLTITDSTSDGLGVKGRKDSLDRWYVGYNSSDHLELNQIRNNQIVFKTNNTERLRIDLSGNLLIGGTLPSAPNISLNADGSIVATATTGSNVGELFVNSGGLALRTNRAPSAVSNLLDLQSSNSGTTESIAAFTTSGDLQIGGTLTGDSRTPNISLTAAGKITAADYDLEALPPLP